MIKNSPTPLDLDGTAKYAVIQASYGDLVRVLGPPCISVSENMPAGYDDSYVEWQMVLELEDSDRTKAAIYTREPLNDANTRAWQVGAASSFHALAIVGLIKRAFAAPEFQGAVGAPMFEQLDSNPLTWADHPASDDIEDRLEKLLVKISAGMEEKGVLVDPFDVLNPLAILAWAWNEACLTVDRGNDPRETTMPALLSRLANDNGLKADRDRMNENGDIL